MNGGQSIVSASETWLQKNQTVISHLSAAFITIGLGVGGLATGHVGSSAIDYALLSGGLALLVGKGVFSIP